MKIAIYSICKNESQFVKRFTDSLTDADAIIVADTGSTDDTLARFADTQATVYSIGVHPWRFDTPRNTALSLVPTDFDVCIKMDLDEVMRPGWRELIEKYWQPGTSRLRYFMGDAWNGDVCTTQYPKSDIHSRRGYFWRYPCHESLVWIAPEEEVVRSAPGLVIEHRQDRNKARSTYLPLLKLAVAENPGPRHWFWLGREYAYAENWPECEAAMQQVIAIADSWELERAWAMRFIGNAYDARDDKKNAAKWYLRACAEAPDQREPWMHLANHHQICGQWKEGYAAALRGLAIQNRPSHYLIEAKWWGAAAYDLAAVCAWKTDNPEVAKRYIAAAVKLDPTNPRLRNTARRLGAVIEEATDG